MEVRDFMNQQNHALLSKGYVTLTVRVRPGAARTELKAVLSDGSVKVDVAAAPEEGEANSKLCRYLAEIFTVPKDHVEILSGATARVKLVRISMNRG